MSAMAAAPATPEFNGFFRDLFSSNCNGCSGCNGAARYSCNGGCSSAASASSNCCGGCNGCNGCCGGLFSGDRIRSLFQPASCCGGCCGGFAYSSGCCGGSMAYTSMPALSYTPMINGGLCFGSPAITAPPPAMESYPSLPGFGVPPPSIPYAPPEAAPSVVPERTGFAPRSGPFGSMTAANSNAMNRATVIVRLPADAQLFADGTALKMTGGERKFVTPALPIGMEYTYRFTAEYERSGERVSVTKKVVVRPGSMSTVEYADLSAAKPAPTGSDAPVIKGDSLASAPIAPVSLPKKAETPAIPTSMAPVAPIAPAPAPSQPAQPASITVKLPPGATLYVDDRKNLSADLVRKFTTPPLPHGRDFAYLFKVEVVRNGMPESVTQKVTFKAGEQLTVDMMGTGR
jgi:uncharacterized protein (TIGR03000 family)